MKNRAIFIFLLFVSFFLIPQVILADGPATRTLEIVYPQIPGVPTPEYVSSGLPEYVNYIFRFAVIIIGILIFGVLVYSGINYLLSFGNPTKLSDAKQGITAAGFGGLILLGAYLIFNTINPQLLILTPPEIGMLKAYIVPGVYLCNYNVDEREDWKKEGVNIKIVMEKYTTNIPDFQTDAQARENALKTRTGAAQKLKDAMGKPGPGPVCFLANYSGPLTNFVIKAGSSDWTLFMIPSEVKENDWEYNWGIIFHENDKFGGKCKLIPDIQEKTGSEGKLYLKNVNPISNFHPQIDFDAKSITIFKNPDWPPAPEAKGVTLYEGQAFNEVGKATTTTQRDSPFYFSPFFVLAEMDPTLKWKDFKPSASTNDIKEVTESELGELKQNTRSIQIEPKNGYIAILQGENKCEVRKTDDANLADDPIGRCGTGCGIVILNWRYLVPDSWCHPCIQSMYVIKGQIL